MSLHILFFFSHHFFFTVVFTLFYHAVEYQVHRNQHAVKQNKTIPHLRTDIPLSLLCMFIHVYIDIYIFNTYIYISDYHGLFLLWFIMALLGKLSTDHNKCVFWHFYVQWLQLQTKRTWAGTSCFLYAFLLLFGHPDQQEFLKIFGEKNIS